MLKLDVRKAVACLSPPVEPTDDLAGLAADLDSYLEGYCPAFCRGYDKARGWPAKTWPRPSFRYDLDAGLLTILAVRHPALEAGIARTFAAAVVEPQYSDHERAALAEIRAVTIAVAAKHPPVGNPKGDRAAGRKAAREAGEKHAGIAVNYGLSRERGLELCEIVEREVFG